MRLDSENVRLAMLGMISGNGHPYSWSAIVNGYDPGELANCPYQIISEYLGRQPLENVGIPGAKVSHIWTDSSVDAPRVAAFAKIPNIVSRPEDVIGKVDAVVIATDDGTEHVRRARPFIEAGLPVFVDKPLAITIEDLRQFLSWEKSGHLLHSSSGLRYALTRHAYPELGALRWITSCTCKSWERYGIHALEAVYPLLGPGFEWVQMSSDGGNEVATILHRSGIMLSASVMADASGSFGAVHLYGIAGHSSVPLLDTYVSFRAQLLTWIDMLRSGEPPFPFEQTVELMLVLIAGIRSREKAGDRITLGELKLEL